MLLTTIDRVLILGWSDGMHAWVTDAAAELAIIFKSVGWQWSGEDVYEADLASKVIDLTFMTARELATTPDKPMCSIMSGRIKVEARRGEIGTQNIALTVMIECVIGKSEFVAA